MIIKLLKQIYKSPDDYAVKTPINELICKIAHFSGGYYLYNKKGDQVGQIMLENNVAYLSVPASVPTYPATIKVMYNPQSGFSFPSNEIERGDEQFLDKIKGKTATEVISLRGDTAGYSYDIYSGNVAVVNVVPSATEQDYYSIRINKDFNVLKGILIVLAIDFFVSYTPAK